MKNVKISVGALGTYFIEDAQPEANEEEPPMMPLMPAKPKDPEKPEKVKLPDRKVKEDNASTEIPMMPNFK